MVADLRAGGPNAGSLNMPDVFVARQPIFNRNLEVVGYELLFRGGCVNEAVVASPEGATATVVLNSFTEIGLERIVGKKTRGSMSRASSC
jgi:c-di-GMP-related signal transduction protein